MHSYFNIDPRYFSYFIDKSQSILVKNGKKETSEIFLSKIFRKLKLEYGVSPFYFFQEYLIKNKIIVELRSYRKSSVFYDVPFPIEAKRQYFLGFRTVVNILAKKKNDNFRSYIYHEFINFFDIKLSLLQKYNEDLLTSATKSRSYQQYRW